MNIVCFVKYYFYYAYNTCCIQDTYHINHACYINYTYHLYYMYYIYPPYTNVESSAEKDYLDSINILL